ncbi:hypothetical protein COL27_29225, partial [Bacillus sp. AFS075960]
IRASASDEVRAAPLDARVRGWRDAFARLGGHRSPPRHYAYAAAICAAITVVASVVAERLDLTNLVMLYLLGVVFSAVRLGRGPG